LIRSAWKQGRISPSPGCQQVSGGGVLAGVERALCASAERCTGPAPSTQPQIDLASALSHVEHRMVSNDYTFSFAGRRYQIARQQVKAGMRGKSLRIELHLSGALRRRHGPRERQRQRVPIIRARLAARLHVGFRFQHQQVAPVDVISRARQVGRHLATLRRSTTPRKPDSRAN
jgi:hypothetical protein